MNREGYCKHGMYVGGCGIDYICGPCEDGADILVEIPVYLLRTSGDNSAIVYTSYRQEDYIKNWKVFLETWPENFHVEESTDKMWMTEEDVEDMRLMSETFTILNEEDTCPACNGTGRDPEGEHYEGSASSRCPECKGTGKDPDFAS